MNSLETENPTMDSEEKGDNPFRLVEHGSLDSSFGAFAKNQEGKQPETSKNTNNQSKTIIRARKRRGVRSYAQCGCNVLAKF